EGSSPTSNSPRPRLRKFEPGASISDLITQGLDSTSPMPVWPEFVLIRTTALSCAVSEESVLQSGATRTVHSTPVIFINEPLLSQGHCVLGDTISQRKGPVKTRA